MDREFALAAEAALIGAVLFDNANFHRMSEFVQADDFSVPAHNSIFTAMTEMIHAGRLADGVTLREHFERGDRLAEIGGGWYLGDLLEAAAYGLEIDDYARLVADAATRRRLTEVGEQIRTSAQEAETGSAAIAQAHGLIEGVAERFASDSDWVSAQAGATSMIEDLRRSLSEGKPRGLLTGIGKLDTFMGGFRPGDLVVLAGASSMGKTALARNIVFGAAQNAARVAFFSQEMTQDQLAMRATSAEARRRGLAVVPYRDLDTGNISRADLDAIGRLPAQLPSGIVVNSASALTTDDVRLKCRSARKRLGGLDLVVVDYLQIMNIPQRNGETRAMAVGRVTQTLKALGKELGCPIVVLSQLARLKGRDNKKPALDDLRDSGAIEQDADKVLFVYREHYYIERAEPPSYDLDAYHQWEMDCAKTRNRVEVHVAKNRMGKIGTVELWIDAGCDLILSDPSELESAQIVPLKGRGA